MIITPSYFEILIVNNFHIYIYIYIDVYTNLIILQKYWFRFSTVVKSINAFAKGPIEQFLFVSENVDRVASCKISCHRRQYSKFGDRHKITPSTHTRTSCKGIYYWNKYKSVEGASISR